MICASAATETAYGRQLYTIGQFQAAKIGLSPDDVQDCAMEFVLRMLSNNGKYAPPPGATSAWLHRCAFNFACNFARGLTRRRQKEQSWTERFGTDAARRAESRPSGGPGPRTLTLRKELWHQIDTAVQRLAPTQQELFVRHFFRGETARELAERFDRSHHAMEVCLSNIRHRVASILGRSGWTDEEIRALFRMRPEPDHAQKTNPAS